MTAADAASRSYRSSLDIKKSAYRARDSLFLFLSSTRSPPPYSSPVFFSSLFLLLYFLPFFFYSTFLTPSRDGIRERARNRYPRRLDEDTPPTGMRWYPSLLLSLSFPLMKTIASTRDFASSTLPLSVGIVLASRGGTWGYRGGRYPAGVPVLWRSGRVVREERGQVERFRMTSTRTDTSMRLDGAREEGEGLTIAREGSIDIPVAWNG